MRFNVGDTVMRTASSYHKANKGQYYKVEYVGGSGGGIKLSGHGSVTYTASFFELITKGGDIDTILKVGDRVVRTGASTGRVSRDAQYTVTAINDCGGSIQVSTDSIGWYTLTNFKRITTEGTDMNTVIARLFERTADAVLVAKHYSGSIQDNDVELVKLQGKQKELLALAQAKEDKANKDK